MGVELSAKRKKRSLEQTKGAKDQRRLSIEVRKRAHALSSTRKMLMGVKGLVKMPAAHRNWQGSIYIVNVVDRWES